mgnify:CR=1 FL=1
MKENKKISIGIIISSGFAFRNYISSNFIDDLKKMGDVILFFPKIYKEKIEKLEELKNFKKVIFPKFKFPKFFTFFGGILSKATNIRLKIEDKYFKKWYISISKPHIKFFLFFQYKIAKIFSAPKFYETLRRYEESNFKNYVNKNFNGFLSKNNIDLLISANPYKIDESVFICHFKEKIPTIGIIISWDNLLWMGHLIEKPSYFFLWGEEMEKDLKLHYPNMEEKFIYKVSSPQFDFHIMEEYFWEKNKFCNYIGANSKKKIIFYSANTPDHFYYEPIFVEKLNEILKKEFKEEFQLVLRIHPHDTSGRFDYLKIKEPEIILQKPFSNMLSQKTYFLTEKEELALFSNILRYSEIAINLASTVTLDAAFFDKPIINIAFSPKEKDKLSYRIPYIHESPHYKKVVKTGAVDIVFSYEELINSIKKYIKNPEIKRKERKAMIEKICGYNGTLSKNRTLKAIEEICKK